MSVQSHRKDGATAVVVCVNTAGCYYCYTVTQYCWLLLLLHGNTVLLVVTTATQ